VVVDAYLDANVDSVNTRRAYGRHLVDALSRLLPEDGTLSMLAPSDLAGHRAAVLADGRGPASHAQAIAALRAFLGWAAGIGAVRLSGDALRVALKTPRSVVNRPYQVLSDTEITLLFTAADTSRDAAIIALMVGVGLRVSEVAALDVADVIDDGQGCYHLHVRQAKGRKDRTVPLGEDVAQLLRAHLADTGRVLGGEGALFRAHDRGMSSRDRHRLSTRAIGLLIARLLDRAGIRAKAISPHSLRHTFAIRCLRASKDVVALQKLLGHAALSTTQRYVDHLRLGELRATLPKLPTAADLRPEHTVEGPSMQGAGRPPEVT